MPALKEPRSGSSRRDNRRVRRITSVTPIRAPICASVVTAVARTSSYAITYNDAPEAFEAAGCVGGQSRLARTPRRRTTGSGLCQISVEKISTESGLGCTKSTAIPVRYAGRQAAAAGAALLSAVLASSIAEASPATCNMRLTVELTPDVPEPLNSGFLSSLLSNQVNYRLTLLGQQPGSVIVAELAGPGPEYRCRNVIEAMRRDGRVLSIHLDQDTAMRAVGLPRGGLDLRPPDLRTLDIAAAPQIGTSPDSDDAVAVTIAAAPLVLEEKSDAQPPLGGFASLRWAARHPTQAWRVFLPMQLDGDDLG